MRNIRIIVAGRKFDTKEEMLSVELGCETFICTKMEAIGLVSSYINNSEEVEKKYYADGGPFPPVRPSMTDEMEAVTFTGRANG